MLHADFASPAEANATSNEALAVPGGMPSGWPVVESGLRMTYFGPVLVVTFDDALTPSAWRRHQTEIVRAIDSRPQTRKYGTLYYVQSARAMDSERRSEMVQFLWARKAELAALTGAFAFVTPSMMARGMLKALFWAAPPAFPYAVASTTREGFAFVAAHVAGVDAASVEAAYQAFAR